MSRDSQWAARYGTARRVALAENDDLRADVLRGLKIANEITLETQSVEEVCTALVRLVRVARAQRDELWDRLVAKNSGGVRPANTMEKP